MSVLDRIPDILEVGDLVRITFAADVPNTVPTKDVKSPWLVVDRRLKHPLLGYYGWLTLCRGSHKVELTWAEVEKWAQ